VANIGRNDPCPCGSGRKYKHCCLPNADAERVLRTRLRAAESRVVPALLAFALENFGDTFLANAWNEFVLFADDIPESLTDDPDFYPLFIPWFVFTYVPDPHEEDAPHDIPTAPIGLVYLDEHGDLDDLDRRLIESACSGGFSFHVVRRVAGEAIELKDILTGAEIRVLEQSGAESVGPDEILFAFPAAASGGAILLGCAELVIPPTWHNRILDFREEMWKDDRPGRDDLSAYDFEIRDFYFAIADAIYDPTPPVLTNTDGETLELTTLTYDLRCSAEEAFDLFKGLGATAAAEPQTAEADDDVERNDDGSIVRGTVRWYRDDQTLLGTVTIEPGVLRAEVNSAERAARIKEEIAARLGDRVVLSNTETVSAGEMMATLADEGDAKEDQDTSEERSPELEAIEAEVMAKHWENWFDEPVPALGHQTPRQAASSALGRERLEALLAEYQWASASQPAHVRPDVDALRRKLGL
jgi:hypothetical protein